MEKLRKSDLLEQVCSFGDKLLKQLFNTTRAELKKEPVLPADNWKRC